ncbi:MAG TPA: ABC transporter substrate-binding protein [Firmicutes bacterium]|nr:ABC transporter substrate-binding protein [Bacillota bacterium]
MFSRRMRLVFIILGIVFVLFSCAQGTFAKTKITILMEPSAGGGWKELEKRFEKANPDIDFVIIEGPSATNIREDMYATSFMAKESTYDLIYMDLIWVPKFAAAGWIIPLDDRFPPAKQKEFLPGDIMGSKYAGKIYRVPVQSDAGMLYYRKDLLAKGGLSVPETWDDLVKCSLALQNPPNLWGFVWQGKQYEGLICDFLEVVWGAGGDLLTEDNQVVIDQPPAVDALQWMVDLIHKFKVSPPGVTTYQEEESRHAFQEGKAIFLRNWPYVWTLSNKDDSPIKGKIGITPMVHRPGPEYKSAATQGGWGLGISAFSKNKEAAWKFIEFATSYEGQKLLHFMDVIIPTRHALFKDQDILKESPHYPDLYKVQLGARPRPMHPRYGAISDALQIHVSAALVKRETPLQALKAAAAEIRDILAR